MADGRTFYRLDDPKEPDFERVGSDQAKCFCGEVFKFLSLRIMVCPKCKRMRRYSAAGGRRSVEHP